MLDVSVRIGVLNLMRSLCEQQGISMLYITHDLASARYLADRIVVMFAGEFVEGGESMALLADPQHPYTRLLISAVPDPHRRGSFDPVERAQLRRQVLHPVLCPFEGRSDSPCSSERAVFHTITEAPEHWVRCGRYAPPSDAPGTALELTDALEESPAA